MASQDGVGWPDESTGFPLASARDESRLVAEGLGWPQRPGQPRMPGVPNMAPATAGAVPGAASVTPGASGVVSGASGVVPGAPAAPDAAGVMRHVRVPGE